MLCGYSLTADQYLSDTMGYLLGCLKKEKERTAAFQALGLLVVAVRAEIQPYLSKVLEIIKAALPPKDFAHKLVIQNSSLQTLKTFRELTQP